MASKYVFQEEEDIAQPRPSTSSTNKRAKPSGRRQYSFQDEEEESSSSSSVPPDPQEEDDQEDETGSQTTREAELVQLEREEKHYLRTHRLPELDFVLTFAHRRVRALLESDEHLDDTNLTRLLATWLADVAQRFSKFETQASKFDELESATLQSQRKHHSIRKQLASAVREERELRRKVAARRLEQERRDTGAREASKGQDLLRILGGGAA
jgi:hypothetical protein